MKAESTIQFVHPNESQLSSDGTVTSEFLNTEETISVVAQQRADMLALWKREGLNSVIEKFGQISEGTLFRWQSILRAGGGRQSVLNPVEIEKKFDIEIDFPQIAELVMPEKGYASTVSEPESDKVHSVINIQAIKEALQNDIHYRGTRISRRRLVGYLAEKYKDQEVLTVEQVQKNEFKPKKLFYIPTSATDATNSIEVAYDDSHVGLWDVCTSRVYVGDDIYPTMDGSALTAYEAKFAYKLFHPKYGNARREAATGELKVRNPNFDPKDSESKKTSPVTREILRYYGCDMRHGRGLESPTVAVMLKALPNIVAQKELRADDFMQYTLNDEGYFNSNFTPKPVPANGTVVLNGVRQYVGRRFEGCMVFPFTHDKALVFKEEQGRRVLVAAFTIVDKENASAIDVGGKSPVPRANFDKTNVREIKYEAKLPTNTTALEQSLLPQKQIELENKVTEAVTQLIESARSAEKLVESELVGEESKARVVVEEKIRGDLLAQAERAIEMAANTKDSETLLQKLESYNFDARTYVALLGSIGVEKMVSKPLDVVRAQDILPHDREVMIRLLRDNYEVSYPGEENEEFRGKIIESLKAAFSRPNTNFYILRDGNEIVSFNRFDTTIDVNDERVVMYFGSFNANTKYRGVGGMLLEHTIQEKLKECTVMQAHCDPTSDISKKYIEDGFIATNTETVAGKFSFEIWRSRDSSAQLITKNKSTQELIAVANSQHIPTDSFFVRVVMPGDEFLELDKDLGYALTRYFTVKGVTYAAFEIPPADLYNQFTTAQTKMTEEEEKNETPH